MKKAAAFTEELRAVVLERCKNRCELCGGYISFHGHFHHRNPRRMGGTRRENLGNPENCMFLHFRCHERIERNRREAIENGWLCYSGDDPADIPVLYMGRQAWLLPDGGVRDASSPVQ